MKGKKRKAEDDSMISSSKLKKGKPSTNKGLFKLPPENKIIKTYKKSSGYDKFKALSYETAENHFLSCCVITGHTKLQSRPFSFPALVFSVKTAAKP